MTAIVARFALSRRAEPTAGYKALRQLMADRPGRRAARRANAMSTKGSSRWTGSSDAIEAPARFAA